MLNLFRNLFAQNPQTSTRSARPSRRRRLRDLSPERLEQRLVPAVYRVTTTGDDVIVVPSGGTGTAGDPFLMGTLRGAILLTNSTVGIADEITFAAGLNGTPITLTLAGEDNAAALGDLDIIDDLTITGNGSANTIIQAGTTNANGIDKVFGINPLGLSDIDVTLSGLTVRFGRNTTNPSLVGQDAGGGIDFLAGGAGASSSSLTIDNCTITNNSTRFGSETSGHIGGGISIREAASATGVVSISNSTISNNTSAGAGGGFGITGANLQVTINDSAVTGNATLDRNTFSVDGGGISVVTSSDLAPTVAFLTIDDSVISANTAAGRGGGVAISGSGVSAHTHVITDTVISGNFSNGDLLNVQSGGGGLFVQVTLATTVTLNGVVVSGNQVAASGPSSDGGGILHLGGALDVDNSTISGNLAARSGGGIAVGAFTTATLTNVTVANNRADSDNNGTGVGGGIRSVTDATVTLENTIVDTNLTTAASVDEVNGTVNADFSLIGNTAGATIVGEDNQLNVGANLGVLADNGAQIVGPTGSTVRLQTQALLSGSPALDAGSNALVPGTITTDQRGAGFARFRDSADANTIDTVDIGAYEAQVSVQNVANQGINEDGSLVLVFNVGDADVPFDSVTATSNNAALVPNLAANIQVTGSGSTRTLTINPLANAFGNAIITLAVNATISGSQQSMSDTFTLTVNPLSDAPNVTSGVTTEAVQTPLLPITPNAVDLASITHFKITNITNGVLFKSNGTTQISNGSFITAAEGAAGVRFTPFDDLVGPMAAFRFDVQAAIGASDANLSGVVVGRVSVSDLPGTWFINGRSAYIMQNGNSLVFINERAENVAGVVVDADTVTATGWGNLVGQLTFNTINWANGTFWTRSDNPPSPVIPSDFRIFGRHAHIEQKGPELLIANERGEISRGRFISDTQIAATAWNDLVGTLVNGNTQINWANGTTWTAPPVENALNVSGAYTINGVFSHIKQNGFALTLVNERGETTPGSINANGTLINVVGWPVTGAIAGNQINWSNNTVWTKAVFAPPPLSHVWTIGGRPTQVDFNNGELFLSNEFGNLTRGVFLSGSQIFAVSWGLRGTFANSNTTINWENGTVWTAAPSIVDAFFANDPAPFD